MFAEDVKLVAKWGGIIADYDNESLVNHFGHAMHERTAYRIALRDEERTDRRNMLNRQLNEAEIRVRLSRRELERRLGA